MKTSISDPLPATCRKSWIFHGHGGVRDRSHCSPSRLSFAVAASHTPSSHHRQVVIAASTASHQVCRTEQPMYIPVRPMHMAVFATGPNVKYANGFYQQPHGKHDSSKSNRVIETMEDLPNSPTSQRSFIHIP